jgi:hypothetical protein
VPDDTPVDFLSKTIQKAVKVHGKINRKKYEAAVDLPPYNASS